MVFFAGGPGTLISVAAFLLSDSTGVFGGSDLCFGSGGTFPRGTWTWRPENWLCNVSGVGFLCAV